MDIQQKQKLAALKASAARHAMELHRQRNPLLQECLQAIGIYQISDETETNNILTIMHQTPIVQFPHDSPPPIAPTHPYAVVWDETQLPVIICSGARIITNWEDIMAVAFDTCLVDLALGRAVLIRK